jgi:hypothetical protein
MYVTKEQVEEMIRQAQEGRGLGSESSIPAAALGRLAEAFKNFAEQTTKTLDGALTAIQRLERRISVLEESRGFTEAAAAGFVPSAPVEPGSMDTADDPGAVVAHAPEAAQPVAVEPAQG